MNFLLQSNETFQKGNARILYSNTNICELVRRIKEKQNCYITFILTYDIIENTKGMA